MKTKNKKEKTMIRIVENKYVLISAKVGADDTAVIEVKPTSPDSFDVEMCIGSGGNIWRVQETVKEGDEFYSLETLKEIIDYVLEAYKGK